jgi:UPF0716 protein FxsA
MPLLILAGVLIGWPLLEIATFILVGSELGVLPTLALIVATTVAGAVLLRQQGVAALMRIRDEMRQGEVPATSVANAGLVALGGVLLLLPGFLSDVIGLALLTPPLRRAVIAFLGSRGGRGVRSRMRRTVIDLDRADWRAEAGPNPGPTPGNRHPPLPPSGPPPFGRS